MSNEQDATAAIKHPSQPGLGRVRLASAAISLMLLLGLATAGRADAAYEQAKQGSQSLSFQRPNPPGEETEQFFQTRYIAVNQSGVGGVEPGSIYVVSKPLDTVMRFTPGQEGEAPQFEEEWGWGLEPGEPDAYARCGPAYIGTANPAEHTSVECRRATGTRKGEHPGQFSEPLGVAVDQVTGDVYVLNARTESSGAPRQRHLVEVLTAKGELVGEGFGNAADRSSTPPKSIAETPSELHLGEGALAVDSSGTVYLYDEDYRQVENPSPPRLVSFEPCVADDYANYCYAAGKDIDAQISHGEPVKQISLIGDDRIVVSGEAAIAEYPIGSQSATPVCTRSVSGQLKGMTVNDLTGELFFYRLTDDTLHRLAPCNEETGTWQELQSIKLQPAVREDLALAVNPTKAWGASRPPGVLYAIQTGETGKGKGYVFVPAEAGNPPAIEVESASDTTSTSTTLTASVNPNGSAVAYHFEYLTEAEYEANGQSFEGPNQPQRAPIRDGHLPAGAPSVVTAVISGLSSGTAYRFRLIADGECGSAEQACEAVGAASSFATFAAISGGLPDGRAYELVSPAEKHAGEVIPAEPGLASCLFECKPLAASSPNPFLPMQSAPDGDAVAYGGYPFSSLEGAAVYNSYVSSRASQGWLTQATSPPLLRTKGGTYLAYSSNLTEGIISQPSPVLSSAAPSGKENLYMQRLSSPSVLVPLVTLNPPHREHGWAIEYQGHSPDFAGQFFTANDTLTQATPYAPQPPILKSTERDLYEWREGSTSLVNVLPGNSAVAPEAELASASPDAHSVSANGRRVFWTSANHVYAREDNQVTREIAHPGTFISASTDGLTVLLSDGCLYSLLSESCTDLSQGQGGFLGLAAQSADLTRIYFVDTAPLAARNSFGQEAQPGKPNLYIYEAGGQTRFITTLGPQDGPLGAQENEHPLNDWGRVPVNRTVEASPDGRYLAIASKSELTGRDNVGPCERLGSVTEGFRRGPGACREVFFYDSLSGRLSCISCSPTGEVPRGNSTLRQIAGAGPWLPQARYVSDQGRVFFDSEDRLSPADVNGFVEDVYEREPEGVGSCTEAGGCVSLVSPGTGSLDSNFLAMGGEGPAEGDDVFFTTRNRLVRTDADELIDVYDARVGGGLLSETEIAPAECAGEACQSAPGAPLTAAPASQSFYGSGNVKPAVRNCAKGKSKRNGKCVKRHHATRKRKRASSHKKRGAK
jgi:hypothetical protein